MNKKRHCLFCGNQNDLTNEHVFPQWLLKHINVPNVRYPFTRTNAFGVEKSVRNLTYYNLKNGNVCSNCNNGWMSSLEIRIKQKYSRIFESPMYYSMSLAETLKSAFNDFDFKLWIYKTAILYNSSTDFYNLAYDFHYEHSYDNSLPKNLMIRVGISSNVDDRIINTIQTIPPYTANAIQENIYNSYKHSFSITLHINHLLLNVCYIHSDYEVTLNNFSGMQIYPDYTYIENEKFFFSSQDDLYDFHFKNLPHIKN